MPAPAYSQADFTTGLQGLLPRGRVWPRDFDATITAVIAGLAASYATNLARANYLLIDAFPATPVELLPDWQATLGLPDPNGPAPPDLTTAQNQVKAKFANEGGQSAAAFIAFAEALGFTVTVENHAPFRVGQSATGQHLGNDDWFFVFTIHGPTALASSEGLLQEIAPAHAILLFQLS